jgi:hypothetical protein
VQPDSGVQNHRQHLYTRADSCTCEVGDEIVGADHVCCWGYCVDVSNIDSLRNLDCIIDFDTKIADRTFEFPSSWASKDASPKLLKVRVLLFAVLCYRTRRACDLVKSGQINRLDHPWRAFASLSALDVAAPEHAQGRHLVDADDLGCGFERDLAAVGPYAGAIRLDLLARSSPPTNAQFPDASIG